jgi:hypothetical protein
MQGLFRFGKPIYANFGFELRFLAGWLSPPPSLSSDLAVFRWHAYEKPRLPDPSACRIAGLVWTMQLATQVIRIAA